MESNFSTLFWQIVKPPPGLELVMNRKVEKVYKQGQLRLLTVATFTCNIFFKIQPDGVETKCFSVEKIPDKNLFSVKRLTCKTGWTSAGESADWMDWPEE